MLRRDLLRPVLLVDDFQRADLLDGAIRRAAVRTMNDLATGGVDGLGRRLPLEVLEVRATEPAKVGPAVILVEKDVGAGLGRSERR